MVKKLSDICLQDIMIDSQKYNAETVGKTLSRSQKEQLLKRMVLHQRLLPNTNHFVKVGLLSCSLYRIELHHSDYIQDYMLKIISTHSQRVEYLSIINCKNVTGRCLYFNAWF